MSGTTAVAMSTIALANSSAAADAAARAEKIAKCMPVLQQPDLSTTAGRQSYATCVLVTEPLPSDDTPYSVKMTLFDGFLVMVLFATLYAWRARHDSVYGGGITDHAMNWLGGFTIAFMTIGAIGLVIGFAAWVFA